MWHRTQIILDFTIISHKMPPRLESAFQPKLDHSRSPVGFCDFTKISITEIVFWIAERRVIEEIGLFGSELEKILLCDSRHARKNQMHPLLVRTHHDIHPQVPELVLTVHSCVRFQVIVHS